MVNDHHDGEKEYEMKKIPKNQPLREDKLALTEDKKRRNGHQILLCRYGEAEA